MALFAGRGVQAQSPSSTVKQSPSAAKSKSKAAHKKSVPATSATAPRTKPATAQTSSPAHRRAPSKTAKRTQAPVAARRPAQQQPTPERYREIQQALADKGYFNGPVDGQWGPESVDALKRFQREQNLTDDGKIGSLSLIGLGLGPKRAWMDQTPEKAQPR